MLTYNIIIVYINTSHYLHTVNVLRRKIVGSKFRDQRAQVTSSIYCERKFVLFKGASSFYIRVTTRVPRSDALETSKIFFGFLTFFGLIFWFPNAK